MTRHEYIVTCIQSDTQIEDLFKRMQRYEDFCLKVFQVKALAKKIIQNYLSTYDKTGLTSYSI